MTYITIIIIIFLLFFLFEDSFKKRKSYKKQISPNPVNRNQTNKPSNRSTLKSSDSGFENEYQNLLSKMEKDIDNMNEDEYTKKFGLHIDFPYWYDIINQRVSLHSNFLYENSSFDDMVAQMVYGHYDEYRNRLGDPEGDIYAGGATYDDEEKVNFIAMRIIGFGLIYDKINNFYIDVKNLVKKYNINKNSLERDEIKLAHAKSSLFGIIKYALNSGYSNVDIKKWYPNYKYDKKDIQGVNSLDVIAKKYDTKSDNFFDNFSESVIGSINKDVTIEKDKSGIINVKYTKNKNSKNPWNGIIRDVNSFFKKNPLKPTFFIWLNENKNDDKKDKDNLSNNDKYKYALTSMLMQFYDEDNIKNTSYIGGVVRGYGFDTKLPENFSTFKEKLDDATYISKVLNSMSLENKVIFLSSLLPIHQKSSSLLSSSLIHDEFIEYLCGENIKEKKIVIASALLVNYFKEIYETEFINFGMRMDDKSKNFISNELGNLVSIDSGPSQNNPETSIVDFARPVAELNYFYHNIGSDSLDDQSQYTEEVAKNIYSKFSKEDIAAYENVIKAIISSNDLFSFKESSFVTNRLQKHIKFSKGFRKELSNFSNKKDEVFQNDIMEIFNKNFEHKPKLIDQIYEETNLIKQENLINSALEEFPEDVTFTNLLAYNQYDQKKYEEGIEYASLAISYDPKRPQCYDTKGEGLFIMEKFDEAIKIMTEGIKLDPNHKKFDDTPMWEHYYNRAKCYVRINENTKAKKDLIKLKNLQKLEKMQMIRLGQKPN